LWFWNQKNESECGKKRDLPIRGLAIQGLQSLRYEILQEQARFDSTPRPTSQDELKVWKAIEQDMTMTLTEIDQSLADYQRQHSEMTDSAKAPPASKMPPLLPD
jgi:hypothetical protein